MGVTVSTLRDCCPGALQHVAGGLSNAASWFSQGAVTFGQQVEQPLSAARGWTGTGQPEAATVAQTNRSAMEIGDIRMTTASNAVLGLYYALDNAHATVVAQLSRPEIGHNQWTVNEDGTVSDYYGRAQQSSELMEIKDEIERTLLGAIAYAVTADQTATALLQRVTSSTPRYGDVADPGALAANAGLSEDALVDLDNSLSVLDLWQRTPVQPVPREQHDPILRFIHDHGELLLDLASFVPGLGIAARLGRGILLGKRVYDEMTAPEPQPTGPTIRQRVDDALRSTDEDVKLEGRVAREAGEHRVVGFQEKVGPHGSTGEKDVETDKAIIEVTNARKGKLSQLEKLRDNRDLNPDGKPVILYAPNYNGPATRGLQEKGFVVVRNREELERALQELGE